MFHTEESLREALEKVNGRSMVASGIGKTHLTEAEYDELPDRAEMLTGAQCSGLDVTPDALRGAATALGSFHPMLEPWVCGSFVFGVPVGLQAAKDQREREGGNDGD